MEILNTILLVIVLSLSDLRSAIAAVVLTDLAFSLDSISAAVAISDRLTVIIVGCGIGIIALRFLANLFQTWIKNFVDVEQLFYKMVQWY